MQASGRALCLATLGLLLLAAAGVCAAAPQGYVLSLSWSPQFCADESHAKDPECRVHAGFTLHGLWPARGDGDAENCKTSQRVPDATIQRMLPLMPNRRLIIHEWRKHGACTGLAPDVYFSLAERAFDSVRIPAEFNSPKTSQQRDGVAIKQDFVAANAKLSADDIELSCMRGELVDVRVCFTSALAPRACADPRQHACEEPLIVRPPH